MADDEDAGRLDELTEAEFRDVARVLRPDLSETEFAAQWAEFCALKRRKQLQ